VRFTGQSSGPQAAITEANDRASIVPDSSFCIRHPNKLEEADFGPLLNVWRSPITVLVPVVSITDRALAIEPLAARKVTLLIYDTGQSSRARNARLQVVKLSKDGLPTWSFA
jgi:hypothetical protein